MQRASETDKTPSQDSAAALNVILAAWEEAADCGIKPELMAYAAIYAALTDLVSEFGESAVANLVGGLPARVRDGEFTLYDTRQ